MSNQATVIRSHRNSHGWVILVMPDPFSNRFMISSGMREPEFYSDLKTANNVFEDICMSLLECEFITSTANVGDDYLLCAEMGAVMGLDVSLPEKLKNDDFGTW